MANEYFILSNFGVRYFLKDYTDSDTVPSPAGPSDEITSVLSCDLGGFSKEVKKYRTLNSNGWESIAPLGQSQDDATFELIREGEGDAYSSAGTTTYSKLKTWCLNNNAGGSASKKCIIEVVPRGMNGNTPVYEGTCYVVIPSQWKPGTKDVETGQEYSITVSPFGPPIPVSVAYTPAEGSTPESWAFTKLSST